MSITKSIFFSLFVISSLSIAKVGDPLKLPEGYKVESQDEEQIREYREYLDKLPDNKRWQETEIFGTLNNKGTNWSKIRIFDSNNLTLTVLREQGLLEFTDNSEIVRFKFGKPANLIERDTCPEYTIKIQRATKENIFFSRTCKNLTNTLNIKYVYTTFHAYNYNRKKLIDKFAEITTTLENIEPLPLVQETHTGYKIMSKGTYITYNPRVTNKYSLAGVWTWHGEKLDCYSLDDKGKRISEDDSSASNCGAAIAVSPITIIKKK